MALTTKTFEILVTKSSFELAVQCQRAIFGHIQSSLGSRAKQKGPQQTKRETFGVQNSIL